MKKYVTFLNNYKDKKTKYLFIKGVKYNVKEENSLNYITINNVKLNKKDENVLYFINELK